jgi:Flp pilus assembly protein TadD
VLLVAGVLTYGGSLNGPFIYDDIPNIVDNQSIHSIQNVFNQSLGPTGAGLYNRSIVRLSFAVNYALGKDHVRGYHILNLAVHLLAGITLFGIVRRTLLTKSMKAVYGPAATLIGFACALIWMLHPLQTQAVTYIIQRCESMMGLFFLLTFYCTIRSWQSSRSGIWQGAAVLSFVLGMGSKEVIAVAPPLLLAYDVIFIHSRLGDAIRKSWPLYASLASGLLLLGMLLITGSQVWQGAGLKELLPWQSYLLTQPVVILHYVRLAVWPDSLCLDYEWPLAGWHQAWPAVLIVAALLSLTAWALYRRKPAGFLGAWFFAILAPTSLVPLPDPAFEHRMYLPLAALVILAVIGTYRLGLILRNRYRFGKKNLTVSGLAGLFILSLLLGLLTHNRNIVYASEVSIWTDTVRKAPGNSRAHLNLGVELDRSGNHYEAIRHFEEAIRLRPDDAGAYTNMGNVLTKLGKFDDAIRLLREAIRLKADSAEVYSNLGVALGRSGRLNDAVVQLEYAVRLKPDYAPAHSNLGLALGRLGRKQEAIAHFQEALRLKPDYQAARMNLELLMTLYK